MAIPKPDSQWGPGTRESNCIATDNGNGFVILRKPDTMSQNSWDYLVWAANNAMKMYDALKVAYGCLYENGIDFSEWGFETDSDVEEFVSSALKGANIE